MYAAMLSSVQDSQLFMQEAAASSSQSPAPRVVQTSASGAATGGSRLARDSTSSADAAPPGQVGEGAARRGQRTTGPLYC
jgi:hypothetical protein